MSTEPKIAPAPDRRVSADTTSRHEDNGKEEAHQETKAVRGGDISAEWLETYTGPRPQIDDKANKLVRNRIDRYLMPICFYIYWCQQLDKSSISFASVFGFQQDANLQGSEYSWLSSIIYFAQLVCQPLSVYALVKFPVNYWVCFCFFGWGASCMICAAFTSFPGLLVFRFILGAFEASIMLIIVTMWWTRREQPLRNNIWYSANGLALILGSLLAYGLASSTHSVYTYQLIFVVFGAIAIVLCVPTFFILPGHPTRAKWLSDEQKYIALERIRLNNTGSQSTHFKWSQVYECLKDPKAWLYAAIVFCVSLVSGGISAFGPLILQGFGLDPFQTILYNMIPGAIGIVSNIIAAYCVQHTKRKSPVLAGLLVFPLAAAAALYALPRGTQYRQQLLAVYFILQIFQPLTPVVFSWTFANTAGHTKKTTMTGMLYIGLCAGNIVGPQVYIKSEAPYYKTGLTVNLVILCVMAGLILLQTLYLAFLNKRNVKRREAMGKKGRAVDYSLEDSSKWASMRAQNNEQRFVNGDDDAGVTHVEQTQNAGFNEHAFDDKTDLENEDFIYSL